MPLLCIPLLQCVVGSCSGALAGGGGGGGWNHTSLAFAAVCKFFFADALSVEVAGCRYVPPSATGRYTFFGKAAELINTVVSHGRFQRIIFTITLGLLALSFLLIIIIFIKLMVTSDTPTVAEGGVSSRSKFLAAISTCIVLLVASIPIAIEVVCTTTMAMGSRRLAERKVIVTRLSAIEELAGMTILCCDKTGKVLFESTVLPSSLLESLGRALVSAAARRARHVWCVVLLLLPPPGTLTQNKLSLSNPIVFGDVTGQQLVFYAALASKRAEGHQDAIDACVTKAVAEQDRCGPACTVHRVTVICPCDFMVTTVTVTVHSR